MTMIISERGTRTQIWREFHGTLVVADSTQFRGLGATGDNLLQRTAALSKVGISTFRPRRWRIRRALGPLITLFIGSSLQPVS
jgi:hypothetical protein